MNSETIATLERILRVVGTLISLIAAMKKLDEFVRLHVHRKPPSLD